MSNQYSGGLITKTPTTPNSISAPGVWTLSQQAAAQATNTWPFPRDPQFKNVTMLLQGNGSAGVANSGAGSSSSVTPFNADASTNNFNVAINGDAKSNNFTPYQGEGYYSNRFDGSGDYLTVPNNAVLNVGSSTFTLECWFFNQQNALSGAEAGVGTIASKSDYNGSNSNGYSLFCYDGNNSTPSTNLKLFLNGVSFSLQTPANAVPFNTWTHVAVVKSGTTVTIYCNGVSVATSSSAPSTINDTSTVFIIGSQINGTTFNGTYPLSGLVSNLRLVKGTAVYTSAFTPPTAPLTAITNTSLLTCQSNRFIDNSTNAFTITKAGDTAVSPAQPFTLPSSVATYGSGFFDGTGDSLSLASSSTALPTGTQDFSVEMYLYWQTQGGSYPQLISNPTTSGFQIYYDVSAGALAVGIFNVSNVITYTIAQTALSGRWTHLVVTRSGNTFRLFVNGVLQSNGTNTISFASLTTQYIASDGSRPYTGYMTDVRTVLGAIPTSYQTSSTTNGTSVFTPPTAPLTAVSSTALLTTQYNGGGNNSGFKDSSQFNFPITRNGNATQGTFTPYESTWSNYFNGSDAHWKQASSTNYILGTNDFTLECWINLNSTSTQMRRLFGVGYGGNGGSHGGSWEIQYAGTESPSGQITLSRYDGSTSTSYSTSGATIVVGQWHHIAVSRTGGNLRIFVDGVAYYNAANTFNFTQVTYGGNTELWVGLGYYGPAGGLGGPRYFGGYMSNIRIINGTGIYSSNFTPSLTPLTAITNTQLLSAQSNRFLDNSVNAQAITTGGSPSVQSFSPLVPSTVYNPATIGGSAYFDGSGDYLSVASDAAFGYGTGDFSLEFWAYPFTSSDNNRVIFHTDDNFNLELINSGGSLLQFFSGSARTSSPYTYTVNAWNHLAITRQSGTARMFINGRLVNNFAFTSSKGNSAVQFGANAGASQFFNGYLSNIRIVKGGIPSAYATSSTTNGTQIFTPSTAPFTRSDSLTAGSASLLLSYTNPAILDNSMMNNLETVGNATVSTSVKKFGAASIYLDGSGDYLKTIDNPSLDMGSASFTIEGWVYVTAASGSLQTLVAKGTGADNQASYHIALNGSTWVYYLSGNGSSWSIASGVTIGTYTINTWQHIALVRNGSTFTPYLNGVAGTTTTSSTALFDSNKPFTVGADDAGTSLLTGYIDDLRITKGVARYTAAFTPPDQAFQLG